MWDGWNEETDVGDPPLLAYYVYYKLATELEFTQLLPKNDPVALAETITGLEPDTDYDFGVAAVRPDTGGTGIRLEVTGSTDCSRKYKTVTLYT